MFCCYCSTVDMWKCASKNRDPLCTVFVRCLSYRGDSVVKKGSFTVEASLVVPFLCFLLAVFLQTILYLHDISIFSAAAYEAAQKGAALKNCSQVEREDYAKETAEKLLENRRMACSI